MGSAFTIITTEKWFDEVMKKMEKYTKFLVDQMTSKEKKFGRNLVIISGYNGDSDGVLADLQPHKKEFGKTYREKMEMRETAFSKFESKLLQKTDEVICETFDF